MPGPMQEFAEMGKPLTAKTAAVRAAQVKGGLPGYHKDCKTWPVDVFKSD